MKIPPELKWNEREKAKFYAWANTADEMEWSMHETEAGAKAWCDWYVEQELQDGCYSEEATMPMAVGYAKIVQGSRYVITDSITNYKYKSEAELPEFATDEQVQAEEGEVWPYGDEMDSVGVVSLHPVIHDET